MKNYQDTELSAYRVRTGRFASPDEWGLQGAFLVPHPKREGLEFSIISSDGQETHWEHVSVRVSGKKNRKISRIPTWEEMCYIKDLFWDQDECVVQFHPQKADYVNMHPHVLHLWRHKLRSFPMPPSILVGFNLREIS